MGAPAKPLAETLTPLAVRLKERIARDGPISVHDYMQACLGDARAGYYATRQPFGREGDFITAPEISQMFGELIGAWAAAVWQNMGAPRHVVLGELGPGRGTLMADALRALKSVPALFDGLRVALIETSRVLREIQRETLGTSPAPLEWFETIEAVPRGPLIVIANEFIDALPVRQLVREGGGWRERAVTVSASGGLAFCAGAPVASDTLPATLRDLEASEGDIMETRPAADAVVAALTARANDAPMAALVADYGHEATGIGDTLQAVHRHNYADPLARPGQADLTAHVDFAALKETAHAFGLAAFGPMPQGEFLLKLGLAARSERLTRDATPEQRAAILSGAARLVDPRQMGLLCKVLIVQSSGLAPPPPFGDI
jgi:NADH dehydrogenase [ubiquinone] 1 alpha subcomplex assembly factor 7